MLGNCKLLNCCSSISQHRLLKWFYSCYTGVALKLDNLALLVLQVLYLSRCVERCYPVLPELLHVVSLYSFCKYSMYHNETVKSTVKIRVALVAKK